MLLWKSKEFLKESIENITTSDNSFAPPLINYYPLPDIKIDGHCLINKNNTPLSIIILYISYRLHQWTRDLNTNYGLYNWLFGSARLTKNADQDKYKYKWIHTNMTATS